MLAVGCFPVLFDLCRFLLPVPRKVGLPALVLADWYTWVALYVCPSCSPNWNSPLHPPFPSIFTCSFWYGRLSSLYSICERPTCKDSTHQKPYPQIRGSSFEKSSPWKRGWEILPLCKELATGRANPLSAGAGQSAAKPIKRRGIFSSQVSRAFNLLSLAEHYSP